MRMFFALVLVAVTLTGTRSAAASSPYVSGFDVYDVPNFPVDVQVADLNGDLRPDLVALCVNITTSVWIQLNLGDGTFAAGDTTQTDLADGLVLADVDGDGAIDVVVHGSSRFVWFHGNGDGTLGARHDFGTAGGSGGHGAVVTDVDGDNLRDVVMAVDPTGLALWRNLGAGTFAAPVAIPTAYAVEDLVSGRWNADARPDLAARVHYPSADSLAVLLNDGAGNFSVTEVTGPMYGSAPFVADGDRDGHLDVITPVEAFRGSGSGTFLTPLLLGEPCVAAGDLEPDGPHDELLFTSLNRLLVRKRFADPPLASALTPLPVAPASDGWRVADLDGDGIGDAVSFYYSASALTVHHGRGLGTFGDPNASTVPAVFQMARIRANGDAFPDVATIGQGYYNDVYVVPGSGPHAFGGAVTLSIAPDYAIALATGDVDGDLIDDLVLAHASGGVSVFPGHGDGTYGPASVQPLGGEVFTAMAAGDLNGDGRIDIAGFAGVDSVAVSLAGPGGVFGAPVGYQIGWGGFPALLQIVEATGDGRRDVVALASGVTDVVVMPGVGGGALGPPVISNRVANATPHAFAVGRLDGDTVPDLVIATDFRLERLLGSATGAFTALPLQLSVRGGTAVAIADLDLDGDADVVMTSQLTCAAHVYRGDGTGALAPGRGYGSGGLAPTAIVVADMDGNGRPDLILGNWLSNDLSVLLAQPALTSPPPGTGPLALAVTPNPTAGAMRASFSLPRAGDTKLEVVDLQGRRVVTRALGVLPAGPHSIDLTEGARLAAGLYWVRLRHPDVSAARRIVIVR